MSITIDGKVPLQHTVYYDIRIDKHIIRWIMTIQSHEIDIMTWIRLNSMKTVLSFNYKALKLAWILREFATTEILPCHATGSARLHLDQWQGTAGRYGRIAIIQTLINHSFWQISGIQREMRCILHHKSQWPAGGLAQNIALFGYWYRLSINFEALKSSFNFTWNIVRTRFERWFDRLRLSIMYNGQVLKYISFKWECINGVQNELVPIWKPWRSYNRFSSAFTGSRHSYINNEVRPLVNWHL